MRLRACCAVWLALLGVGASAQVSKPGTGTVTGHVICEDTQKPARFANVMLFGVPVELSAGWPNMESMDQKAIEAAVRKQMEAMRSATFVQTETGIDGSFVAANVPPGDYYLMASVPGYVHPRALLEAANDAGEDLTKGIAGMPMLHVSADRTAEANVSVPRGAAMEGHVLWDDGGAVSGAQVQAESTQAKHKNLPPQFSMMNMGDGLDGLIGTTDDRGRYRISGLAPGEYKVMVMLQTNRGMTMDHGRMNSSFMRYGWMPLTIYAPAAFRKGDAKPVTLSAGEDRSDEDITFNLAGTHSVSGRVTSAEDHHALNQGVVILTDTTDKAFSRSAVLDDEGNFSVAFVPPGTYTMAVTNAADTAPKQSKPETDANGNQPIIVGLTDINVVHRYEKGEQQVTVTDSDVTGQTIELKPSKATPAQQGGIGAVAGGIP